MKMLQRGASEREYTQSFVKVRKFLEKQNGKAITQRDAEAIRHDLELVLETYESVRSFDSARDRVRLSGEIKNLLHMLGYKTLA